MSTNYKLLLLAFSLCFILPFCALAQPGKKAETEFINQLNEILRNSPQHHWAYEGTMTIDSVFTISKEGVLSVTLRYTNDSSCSWVRMAAPVNKIGRVVNDVYLILEFKEQQVAVFTRADCTKETEANFKTNLFHIGTSNDAGDEYRLQQALSEFKKFLK